MLVEFEFEEPRYFQPSAMARMLIDLDGLFFFSVAIDYEPLLEKLTSEELTSFKYSRLVYLGSHFDKEDSEYSPSGYHSKVSLESVSFASPPKVSISLNASISCQQIVKSILDFVKFLLTLKEHKTQMQTASYREMQQIISREFDNLAKANAILDDIHDENLKKSVQEAIVERTVKLLNSADYPPLKRIYIRKMPEEKMLK